MTNFTKEKKHKNTLESQIRELKKSIDSYPEDNRTSELKKLLSYESLDYHIIQSIMDFISEHRLFLITNSDADLSFLR